MSIKNFLTVLAYFVLLASMGIIAYALYSPIEPELLVPVTAEPYTPTTNPTQASITPVFLQVTVDAVVGVCSRVFNPEEHLPKSQATFGNYDSNTYDYDFIVRAREGCIERRLSELD